MFVTTRWYCLTRHFELCMWQLKKIYYTKPDPIPDPNQSVSVPKPKQIISTALSQHLIEMSKKSKIAVQSFNMSVVCREAVDFNSGDRCPPYNNQCLFILLRPSLVGFFCRKLTWKPKSICVKLKRRLAKNIYIFLPCQRSRFPKIGCNSIFNLIYSNPPINHLFSSPALRFPASQSTSFSFTAVCLLTLHLHCIRVSEFTLTVSRKSLRLTSGPFSFTSPNITGVRSCASVRANASRILSLVTAAGLMWQDSSRNYTYSSYKTNRGNTNRTTVCKRPGVIACSFQSPHSPETLARARSFAASSN